MNAHTKFLQGMNAAVTGPGTRQVDQARALLTHAIEYLAAETVKHTGIGYRPQAEAPDNWEALQQQYAEALDAGVGMISVYSGASDCTIYTSPHANYAFRYWHDTGHVQHGLSFTPEDERALQTLYHIREMRAALWTATMHIPGYTRETLELALQMYKADTLGQIEYVVANKRFPNDQLAFVLAYLSNPALAVASHY